MLKPLSKKTQLVKMSVSIKLVCRILFVFFHVFILEMNAGFAQTPKPNIILIAVDDLGWSDLACYGNSYHQTPNINQLALDGMLFTNAYAAAAICSPTRAALLTGKAPARTGITDWIRARFQGGVIPKDKKYHLEYVGDSSLKLLTPSNPLWMELQELTLAELLKSNGYTTCHVGKWHLGTEDWYPEKQGFDYNYGGTDYGEPPSYFDPYYRNEQAPGITTLPPRKKGEYLEDRLADESINFIRTHRDKPFFLNLWNYAVHIPIQGKPELLKKYEEKTEAKYKSAAYAALVESVDETVGKIVATLKELKLENNTLIVFTSDNGGLERNDATDNDPLRAGKGYPYEGGIRIPLIVKWPGKIKPSSRTSTSVISYDWFPTLAAIAGIDISNLRQVDGKNLNPLLQGKKALNRNTLYWHFPHYREEIITPYSIIREGNLKLIKWYEGNRFELYDLDKDLSEAIDLSEKMPLKVKQLNKKLDSWLRSVNAKLPVANSKFKTGLAVK